MFLLLVESHNLVVVKRDFETETARADPIVFPDLAFPCLHYLDVDVLRLSARFAKLLSTLAQPDRVGGNPKRICPAILDRELLKARVFRQCQLIGLMLAYVGRLNMRNGCNGSDTTENECND